ncbi:MAG: SlyX family protein [Planctomycetes bacterium]|nr:SlyX family protein [Planctomycetota bacterium]
MKNPDDRLVELEVLFTHLQKTITDLDEVVVDQSRRIDQLQRELKILAGDVRLVRESSREQRRPEDEIPPHY